MKSRSFRMRIAVLAALISGAVLAVFGISAWLVVSRIDLARLDSDLAAQCLRHMSRQEGGARWQQLENLLDYVHGGTSDDAWFVLVKDRDGRIAHQSDYWPEGLSTDEFPAAATADLELMPPPDGALGLRPGERPPPPDGHAASRPGRPAPPAPPAAPPRMLLRPKFRSMRAAGRSWRVIVAGTDEVRLVVGMDLAGHGDHSRRVLLGMAAVMPLALALVALGGWLLAGRALAPVRKLTEATEAITARGLDQRIPEESEDVEFARLIRVFNEMMERLERSFGQATRFSADSAHELKTPLTILHGELAQALHEAEAGSAQQQVYSDLLEEVQRLRGIVRKLLLLAQADAGELRPHLEPMDLSRAVEANCEDIEVLAPELTVSTKLQPDVSVMADPDLLNQVLQNLVVNAIKYNREDGEIRVSLSSEGGKVSLTIANTGEPIPAEHRERVFDRFYRADPSHGRSVDGVGLGLSLAREIVRAHGGELRLDDREDGMTAFTVTLPAAADRN